MALETNHIEIARIGDAVAFRVNGLGNMLASPAIWGLAERMMQEGVSKFAFELSHCLGLDSTFMGMLVGLAHRVSVLEQGGWVCVVNASAKVREGLELLGVTKFVRLKTTFPFEDIEMQRLDVGRYGTQERLEIIRRAHEALIEIDRRNRARFGPFLESLSKELED